MSCSNILVQLSYISFIARRSALYCVYSEERCMKSLVIVGFLLLVGCGQDSEVPPGLIVGDSVMMRLPLTNYRGSELTNKAIGGTRCDSSVDTLVNSGKQGVVILGCGHNGTNYERVTFELQRAINYCDLNCRELIIVNLNPVRKYPDREPIVIQINDWIDRTGVIVVDFYSWSVENQNEEMFFDGLHPTPYGYSIMVDELFR